MSLREELDDLMFFEATGSKLAQRMFKEKGEIMAVPTNEREVMGAMLAMIRGVGEAIGRLADEVEALKGRASDSETD